MYSNKGLWRLDTKFCVLSLTLVSSSDLQASCILYCFRSRTDLTQTGPWPYSVCHFIYCFEVPKYLLT